MITLPLSLSTSSLSLYPPPPFSLSLPPPPPSLSLTLTHLGGIEGQQHGLSVDEEDLQSVVLEHVPPLVDLHDLHVLPVVHGGLLVPREDLGAGQDRSIRRWSVRHHCSRLRLYIGLPRPFINMFTSTCIISLLKFKFWMWGHTPHTSETSLCSVKQEFCNIIVACQWHSRILKSLGYRCNRSPWSCWDHTVAHLQ